MRNFFWSDGNDKMNKTAKAWQKRFKREAKFISFNIPQLQSKTGQKTCPYAGTCADICYASQGRHRFNPVKEVREKNLARIKSLSPSALVDGLSEDIGRMRKTTHIRIHDSGDFFRRDYYRSWINVAKRFPEITFYAYTKSIPMLEWDKHTSNFRIVQSFGGKRDSDIDVDRPHAKIFATESERKKARYINGNDSDIPAVIGCTRIGLVYHGTKNLTEENLIQLRAH